MIAPYKLIQKLTKNFGTNRFIANCPQGVPVKEFLKSANNWRKYGQKLGARFLRPIVYKLTKYSTTCPAVSQRLYLTGLPSHIAVAV